MFVLIADFTSFILLFGSAQAPWHESARQKEHYSALHPRNTSGNYLRQDKWTEPSLGEQPTPECEYQPKLRLSMGHTPVLKHVDE